MDTDYINNNQRFWSKVEIRGPDECWPWLSVKNKGYGLFSVRGIKVVASRHALELATGKPLRRMMACHTCDNPACCNPSHLYAGSHADNTRDAISRGRMTGGNTRGQRNGAAKLSDAAVRAIKLRIAGGDSTWDIAAEHGVTEAAIRHIKAGRNWKEQNADRT